MIYVKPKKPRIRYTPINKVSKYYRNHNNKTKRIINIICNYYQINPNELRIKNRKKKYVIARQVITYFLHNYQVTHKKNIPSLFGLDRTTFYHSYISVINQVQTDYHFRKQIDELDEIIKNV